jgi:hypothetical protein
MLGFFSHWLGIVEFEAPGVDLGSTREQVLHLGSRIDNDNKPSVEFNFDVDGDGAPNSYSLSSGSFTPAYPFIKSLAAYSDISLITDSYGSANVMSTSTAGLAIRGTYSSDAVLSPRTRTIKATIFRPDLLGSEGFDTSTNNGGKTSANNNREGNLSYQWSQFPNLQQIYFNEGLVTSVQTPTPRKVKNLVLKECAALTNLPDFSPSLEYISLSELPVSGASGVSANLANCTNLKYLNFAHFSPYPELFNQTTTLSGTLDLSATAVLEQLIISLNTGLSGLTLNSGLNTLKHFYVGNCGAIATSVFDTVLANNSGLLSFIAASNTNSAWNRNFNHADLPTSLRYFWIYNSNITGDIDLSTSRASLLDVRLGNLSTSNNNTLSNIDLSGCTGLRYLDLVGCDCTDLQLPTLSTPANFSQLYAHGNALSLTTNPDLITKINSYTGLTTLYLGSGATGQSSLDGIGANPDLSGLVNMTTCALDNTKATGTLVLPNVNKITTLQLTGNTGLTGITNITAHTSLNSITINSTPSLNFSFASFTSIRQITANGCGITTLDLSGRTTTNTISIFSLPSSTSLTSITFPTTEARCNFITGIDISGCTSLSALTNQTNINYSIIANASRTFAANGCALNINFQFGANNFLPYVMSVQNNAMSTANVDANIDTIYTNRAKWSSGTIKTLNIAGTNGAATGTYQAPPGFVMGVSDGTPASAKEQIYVLVNNHNWSITYN